MPEGWKHIENESSNSYFEQPEGAKGLYVKAIELPQPKTAAKALAEYVQDAQLRSYEQSSGHNWEVMDSGYKEQDDLVRSILDLYDAKANYRVLSFVVCDCREAIQITVHDYWCEDYAATRNTFVDLAASISKVQVSV